MFGQFCVVLSRRTARRHQERKKMYLALLDCSLDLMLLAASSYLRLKKRYQMTLQPQSAIGREIDCNKGTYSANSVRVYRATINEQTIERTREN